MADFGEYPPNLPPQDALIVRQQAEADHAVVPYSAENLAKPVLGPANPFKDDPSAQKRKNVLTGHAEETFLSEHTFRSKHRAVERKGGPEREQNKGDATITEGPGSYVGPWAKYSRDEYEVVGKGEVLQSDEEFEVIDEDEDVVESEVEELGDETTTLHGVEEHDYQGRTYMHVPQDLDIDLRKDVGSTTNYIPKKQIHAWKDHSMAVTALRFFPSSGHLLLSSSADSTVKIRDVYHERQLLRTYSGHSKAISDICFNFSGTQFLSSSYDRMIKLWDTETGTCISKFTTGKTPHVIKFNPDPEHANEFLAGMSDKKIVQFDTRTPNEMVQEYDHHLAAINTITFVDQNRRFMTTSDDKSLRAWDYNIPVPIKYIAEPDMYPMTNSTLHSSGKYVAYQSSDNQILVYGANDKFRQNRKKSYRGHNNAGLAIDLDCSPDGQFLASGDSGGYVCFWDWKTCKMYHKLKAGSQAVTCVRWHPQETSKVATAGLEGEIRYWD
ncbi:WD domain, g-beta repeat domain-containing protein [Hirsutella rhossiliensis]|uniref:WD domain, g-beta repeat domain-containing protein n=1 Tax=Hirsutella rhossiliensis TaxID=111463 RepID=A0A9P8MKD5_9HYPO|nr:WD domain, g-beta repeat domain-containing protein [Hirsutella rhossiliensis]KAH0957928.1 WD domain, g-beta repeat domain-containing protein [Hirsutella rhossiliensis]